MFGHVLDAFWTEYFQRLRAFQYPRGKNEIRIAGRVVGVQMCAECDHQPVRAQGINSLLVCFRRLTDNARTKIYKISAVAYDNCRRRTTGIRAGIRGTGSEKYKLCFHHKYSSPKFICNIFCAKS